MSEEEQKKLAEQYEEYQKKLEQQREELGNTYYIHKAVQSYCKLVEKYCLHSSLDLCSTFISTGTRQLTLTKSRNLKQR